MYSIDFKSKILLKCFFFLIDCYFCFFSLYETLRRALSQTEMATQGQRSRITKTTKPQTATDSRDK